MAAPAIYRLGAARKVSGECNVFDKVWPLEIGDTEHQITMKRNIIQKLVVKHNGNTLLDKRFFFSKPPLGHCVVEWDSEGVSFGVYYQTNIMSARTNADHYELYVNGRRFADLPDASRRRSARQRADVETALRRLSSVPAMVVEPGIPASARNLYERTTTTSSPSHHYNAHAHAYSSGNSGYPYPGGAAYGGDLDDDEGSTTRTPFWGASRQRNREYLRERLGPSHLRTAAGRRSGL